MNLSWSRITQLVDRHRIIYGIILALLISVLLTTISMALYISSGASRLDLSRPGYEKARGEVVKPAEEEPFSTTGPITGDVVEDFQKRFDKHRDTLNKLEDFGSSALEDNELQIAPGTNQ